VENYRRDAFLRSVEESLRKLRTDHVDLLLLHWPNDAVPLAEQIGALNEVRKAGKARHIGISNFNVALMAEAVRLSEAPIVTNQVEYHPYLDQTVVIGAMRRMGAAITAYYGMADGRVLGDPVLKAIAARHSRSVAQLVLRWLVQQEGIIALSKTVSETRAAENLAIFDFVLTPDEMAEIHALARVDGRLVSPPGLAPEWDPPAPAILRENAPAAG
jgi:2,5-diketo-D-gluconate reductase B